MKKLFFLVLLFSNFFGYCQYTAIPDVNFEKALMDKGFDTGMPDGKVLTMKISKEISLQISGKQIFDLTGIQDFTALTRLECDNNNLTNLDVSNNMSLWALSCTSNQLTSLKINASLTALNCNSNKLISLDISKNTLLLGLNCSGNLLTSLDVSQNPVLTDLYTSYNKLTSLDVSKNTKLYNLWCSSNQLTSIDISKNIALGGLDIGKNQLTYLNLTVNKLLTSLYCPDNQLTTLDISKNTLLSSIWCNSNQLVSLNLRNGINNTMNLINFISNPSLTCIQVDNKSYSDTNWSSFKDVTASYSEDCSKTTNTIKPPEISATGNQIYCPGTPLKIVETISIKPDPAEPTTDAVYIQISSGYVSGQDVLTLTGIHPNVSSNWIQPEGKLYLYSTSGNKIPYSDFEAAIKDVVFETNNTSAAGTRTFSITIGQANYLPSTGHYYQFVSDVGITWTSAKTAAEALNYYGLKGYLATISSIEETKITGEQASGAGWIGGSDAEAESVWKWVTGPEGLANGGTGITFWNGLGGGSTPNFAYWNTNNNEPNNLGDEDFAHITAIGVGIPGSWNDLSNTGGTSGAYQPKGFIVEYGGMPGDPPLKISASTSLTVGKIEIVSTPSPICNSGSVTFRASANGLPIKWYDSLIGGNLVGTGNDFTTPVLTSDKSYFADAGCTSIARTAFKAVVNAGPILSATTTSVSRCGAGSVVLNAVTSAGAINWYSSLSSVDKLQTGNSFTTPNITSETTFYAEAVNNGCVSALRVPVKVIVNPFPQVTNQEITKCKLIDIELDAALPGMEYLWSTGAKTQKITVSSTGIYFVDITSPSPEKCKSRKTITVLENNIPEIDRVEGTETSATIYLKKDEIYFEYSIDGVIYQNSNVFFNVPSGFQTAYVRELNFCSTDQKDFTIFRIKKYFTPNNDGINDLWEINEMKDFPTSSAYIYDRYGKLIIKLNAAQYSWDGMFNSKPLPSDDYWFRLKLDNSKPEVTGHFSLKR